jgi:hypothetical protein
MIEVVKIVVMFLLVVQTILAISSWWDRVRLERKFAFPLGSQTSTADMLELYSRIFGPVNIKVNAAIKGISSANGNLLLINRHQVYRSDLFSTCYTLWVLHLLKEENQHLRRYHNWQLGGFSVEIILVALGFYYPQLGWLLAVAAVLILALLLSSYIYQYRLRQMKQEYLYVAMDLLSLDKLETMRAESLGNRLSTHPFSYPVGMVHLVVRFFNPF